MTTVPECEHDYVFWLCLGPNEEGWRCEECGHLGFRPDLDRERTVTKVHNILLDFHQAKLVYISNGTMGEIVSENVANRCHQEGIYDQESILRFILTDPNIEREHAQFWKNRAERWLLGGEPIRQEQDALPFERAEA